MTTSADPALLDTNVLVYAVFPAMPDHAASRALVDRAKAPAAALCVPPQNVVKFFSVVTDARRVTQPKTPDEALQAIDDLLALPGMTLLSVRSDLVARWSRLVRQVPTTNKRAFDTQLVATMQGNGVAKIYTFNTAEFQPFPGIQVLTP